MKGKKGTGKPKVRVRFCRLDYYRYLCTGETSNIQNIDSYYATSDVIRVFFSNGFDRVYNVNKGERQLKEVIKLINNYLGGNGDGTQQQLA